MGIVFLYAGVAIFEITYFITGIEYYLVYTCIVMLVLSIFGIVTTVLTSMYTRYFSYVIFGQYLVLLLLSSTCLYLGKFDTTLIFLETVFTLPFLALHYRYIEKLGLTSVKTIVYRKRRYLH